MTAKIKILDGNEVFKKFELHYTSHEHLNIFVISNALIVNELFHFVRKAWNEYLVQFEVDNFVMTASHTYKEQMARQKTIDAIDENTEWLAI